MKLSEKMKERQLEDQIVFNKYNSGAKYIPIDICFMNHGREDETQFDVADIAELQECWAAFCKEEHIPEDCVLDVYIGEEDDDFDYEENNSDKEEPFFMKSAYDGKPKPYDPKDPFQDWMDDYFPEDEDSSK